MAGWASSSSQNTHLHTSFGILEHLKLRVLVEQVEHLPPVHLEEGDAHAQLLHSCGDHDVLRGVAVKAHRVAVEGCLVVMPRHRASFARASLAEGEDSSEAAVEDVGAGRRRGRKIELWCSDDCGWEDLEGGGEELERVRRERLEIRKGGGSTSEIREEMKEQRMKRGPFARSSE